MKCSVCEKNLTNNILNYLENQNICINCLKNLKFIDYKSYLKIKVNQKEKKIPLYIMYEYNDYAKQLMYKLKEQRNLEVTNLFKILTLEYINSYFNEQYKILPIRSSHVIYKTRGFNPTEELLSNELENKIIQGPKRLDSIKQGKKNILLRRKSVHEYEKFMFEQKDLENIKNLIILDDVITTGKTIENFINNLNIDDLQKIKILVLFKGKYFKE